MSEPQASKSRHTAAWSLPPTVTWWAPGRVNLIGEHTDYNDGFALPFAVPAGVSATVAATRDGVIRVRSGQKADVVELPFDRLVPGALRGWAAYPVGAVWAITTEIGSRAPCGGLDIALDGDVPLGAGLASSAAVVCSAAAAIADLLDLDLSPAELVTLTRRAENDFVGAPTGGLDQTASLLCEAGNALLFDARSATAEQVPLDLTSSGLAVLVTDSRIRHAHAGGGYADRRTACTRAAATLGVTALRDVGVDELADALRALADDEDAARAARHVVTENARVLETVALLRKGEVEAIGSLLDASHDSLRDVFRISTPEVDLAVEVARAAGALGARITGGGFGGCTIALARSADVDVVKRATSAAYTSAGYASPRFWTVRPSLGASRIR